MANDGSKGPTEHRFQQPIEGFVHVAGAPFVHGCQPLVRGNAVVTLNPAMNSGMGR